LSKKYIIFKDDDVGNDTQSLKKWIDIIQEKNVKSAIGLIGRCMKDRELVDYLNSLDTDKIEIFCHGYYHKQLPYIIRKMKKSKELPKTEFNKDFVRHNRSLKKYRLAESKYMKTKAITFGPQGNIWNDNVIDAVIQNDFKLMFSWRKIKAEIFTIPLTENLKQSSFEEFLKDYKKNKNDEIFTLQFHHEKLTDKQFELMIEVIDFFKNKEKRTFIKPSELLELVHK